MSAFHRVKTTMYVMVFRRKPSDLGAVPDELLRAEALRRGLVVLPPVAAEALARWLVAPSARAAELETLLAVERERSERAEDVAFRSFERGQRALAEASHQSAITALGDLGFGVREAEAWCRAGYARCVTGSENKNDE